MKLQGKLGSIGSGNLNKDTYVAYYHKMGISVIKNKPKRKRNSEFSDKQIQARRRFTIISKFTFANKTAIIKPIWNLSPENTSSGYNLFKKYNSKAFAADGEIIDPSVLYASIGSLPLPINIDINSSEDKHSLQVSWSEDKSNYKNQYENTLVYCTLVDEDFFNITYTDVKRKDLSTTIEIKRLDDLNDYIYIFFTNKDRSAFSNSRALRFKD
ncbi:MAG: hypothetical protein WBG43_05500 [Marinifilaceae bacterium]